MFSKWHLRNLSITNSTWNLTQDLHRVNRFGMSLIIISNFRDIFGGSFFSTEIEFYLNWISFSNEQFVKNSILVVVKNQYQNSNHIQNEELRSICSYDLKKSDVNTWQFKRGLIWNELLFKRFDHWIYVSFLNDDSSKKVIAAIFPMKKKYYGQFVFTITNWLIVAHFGCYQIFWPIFYTSY